MFSYFFQVIVHDAWKVGVTITFLLPTIPIPWSPYAFHQTPYHTFVTYRFLIFPF